MKYEVVRKGFLICSYNEEILTVKELKDKVIYSTNFLLLAKMRAFFEKIDSLVYIDDLILNFEIKKTL